MAEYLASERSPESELGRKLEKAQSLRRFTESDTVVLENFITHIVNPSAPYAALIEDVAVHFSNVLGAHPGSEEVSC